MNKGFTLIEMMLVLFILVSLTLIFSIKPTLFHYDYFNPVHCQLKAMSSKEKCELNKTLHFNANGNINHAQTISINKKTCVFQLGMGRYRCE